MKFLSVCLPDSIELQKKIIIAEKQLFLLNPASSALQIQRRVATVELAAARATANIPGIALASLTLAEIESNQEQLQLLQRSIILATDALIKVQTANIKRKIRTSHLETAKIWNYYFETFFSIRSEHFAEMAVQPQTSGLAPNYELKAGFKELQTVAFNWQFKYFTKSESQMLLNSQNSFLASCGTQPERKANTWSVEILKDKYF